LPLRENITFVATEGVPFFTVLITSVTLLLHVLYYREGINLILAMVGRKGTENLVENSKEHFGFSGEASSLCFH